METHANWMPSIFPLSADDDDDDADGDAKDRAEVTFPQKLQRELTKAIEQLLIIKTIKSSQDVATVKAIADTLWRKGCLPGFSTAEKMCNLDKDSIPWHLIANKEYADLLQAIASLFSADWPSRCSGDERSILNLYKIDYNFEFIYESWLCLTNHLSNEPLTLMNIFKFLLDDDSLLFVTFLQVCKEKAKLRDTYKETIEAVPEPKLEEFNVKAKHLLQMLISLPTRLANCLKGNVIDSFLGLNYCHKILQHFVKALWFLVHCDDALLHNYFDIKFLSDILARLVTEYCKEVEMDSLLCQFLQVLEQLCHIPKAQKLIQNIFGQMDDSIAIYRLALCMLKGNLNIYTILGSTGKNSGQWSFCFMQKLSLQRIPSDDQCLVGMVNYIAKLDCTMLREFFENILNIWSKRTSLQKLSHSEHKNMSKLLVLSGKYYCTAIDGDTVDENDQEVKRLLHVGLRHHLECPNAEQMYIGMKCVEEIFNCMCSPDTKDEDRLKFDYSAVMETSKGNALKEIDKLLENSTKAAEKEETFQPKLLEKLLETFMTSQALNETTTLSLTKQTKALQVSEPDIIPPPAKSPRMELDSDDDDDSDDLKPYDMSNDIPELMEKRPKFLLDLLSTLSTKCENYEIFESALASAETLIRSQLPRSDSRLAVDLMQLFLPLDMQYYFENFEETKFKCCVAICVAHPIDCSEYICQQFHTDNSCYSVNLRILMLQTLAAAAKELSGNTEKDKNMEMDTAVIKNSSHTTHMRKFKFENEQQERLALAQQVIKQRLREKTKKYFTKPKTTVDAGKANRFHSVVGTFFFALVRGDRTKQMLYVKYDRLAHDIDTMLMVNFLHTLSVFIMAAQNCPLLPALTREIFDLCSFVRFSPESRIRLTCLELLGITLVTTPGHILIEQFNDRLLDLRYWLEDFVKSPLVGGETSEECRDIATQILNTCYKIMNPNIGNE